MLGAGIVAGVAGRMDVDLLVRQARAPQGLLGQARHADGQVEDLADGRALAAAVDAGAAEDVVGGDAALAVGRPGQRNDRPPAAGRAGDLDGVAHGADGGVAGPHVLVDDDAAGRADLQARLARQSRLRPHAHRQDHQAAGDRLAAREVRRQPPAFRGDGRDARPQPQVHAVGLQVLVDGGDHLRVGGDEDLRGQFDQRDLQAPLPQGLGHLQADVPAADDHGPCGFVADQRPA